MPIRAVDADGTSVVGFDLSPEAWSALRARTLTMPCCESRAIPKVSQRGLRFFAHKARGGCDYKAETHHHLAMKAAVLRAAQSVGWSACAESRGRTSAGDEWIADVLCEGTLPGSMAGTVRVAFEIQWSHQDQADFERRQARYAASGVRCFWLRRLPSRDPLFHLECRRDLPIFGVREADGDYLLPQVGETVEDFARTVMLGGLRFWPRPRAPAHVEVFAARYRCFHCNRTSTNFSSVRLVDVSCGSDEASPAAVITPDGGKDFFELVRAATANRPFDVGGFDVRVIPRFPFSNVNRSTSRCITNLCKLCGRAIVTEPYWLGSPRDEVCILERDMREVPCGRLGTWFYKGQHVSEYVARPAIAAGRSITPASLGST